MLSNAFLTTPDEFENKDKMQKKILETPWERSWEQNSVLVEIYLTVYVKKHLTSFPGSLFSASPQGPREAEKRGPGKEGKDLPGIGAGTIPCSTDFHHATS